MKIWRSPILYLGLVIVFVLTAALIAPYVINWNNYRTNFEAQATKLIGRKLTLSGPISVRFFPWPRLTLGQLRIEGEAGQDFIRADRLDVHMSLASLINGNINVESVTLNKPLIILNRDINAQGNWPTKIALQTPLFDSIQLNNITLVDGNIFFHNERSNRSVEISNFNAKLSSQSLHGPWRLTGAARYQNEPFLVTLNMGAFKENTPLILAAQITPDRAQGLSYRFNGSADGQTLIGDLIMAPFHEQGSKGDLDGPLQRLTFQSKAKISFDSMNFDEFKITSSDNPHDRDLFQGHAEISLERQPTAFVKLTASEFDPARFGVADTKNESYAESALKTASSLVAIFPESADIALNIEIDALHILDKIINRAVLNLSVNKRVLAIRSFSGSLAGRSSLQISGMLSAEAEKEAAFSGQLNFITNDLRAVANIIMPNSNGIIREYWQGISGKLSINGPITFNKRQFSLQQGHYLLDNVGGQIDFTNRFGEGNSLNIAIKADKIDLDQYISKSIPLESRIIPQYLRGFSDIPAIKNLNLSLQANRFQLNRQELKMIELDMLSGPMGVEVKRFSLGLDEAKFSASGQINWEGEIKTKLLLQSSASQPIMRFLGLRGPVDDPMQPGFLQMDIEGGDYKALQLTAKTEIYGFAGNYIGSLALGDVIPHFKGKLEFSALRNHAEKTQDFLPFPFFSAEKSILTAAVFTASGLYHFDELTAQFDDNQITGHFSLSPNLRIEGSFSLSSLKLMDILRFSFFPYSADFPKLDDMLIPALPLGLSGTINAKVDRLIIANEFEVNDAQMLLSSERPSDSSFVFSLTAKDPQNRDMAFNLDAFRESNEHHIKFHLLTSVDLQKQLHQDDGTPPLIGNATLLLDGTAKGRTLAGLLCNINGGGNYRLKNLALAHLSIENFSTYLSNAKNVEDIFSNFDKILTGPSLPLGDGAGQIILDNGRAVFAPLDLKAGQVSVRLEADFDISTQILAFSTKLVLEAFQGIKPLIIAYNGQSWALHRFIQGQELATQLSTRLLQKGVDRLERLRQEQIAAAAQEETKRLKDKERLKEFQTQREELQRKLLIQSVQEKLRNP